MCRVLANCSTVALNLDEFKMRFDDEWYFLIPPSQFLINGTRLGNPGYCYFGVKGGLNSDSSYIFGDVFLKNFYLIFDNDNYRVGIAIKTGSNA